MNIALSMYVGEPCRICGCLLTVIDVRDGAVFAGYSKDNKSRAAHKLCWNNAAEIHRDAIATQEVRVDRLSAEYDELWNSARDAIKAKESVIARLKNIIRKVEWIEIHLETRSCSVCSMCASLNGTGHAESCPFYKWEKNE